ncbi:DNA polymerase III subunit gamma/tau [Candidatus Cyanaurora vandensis]|uniref:DNA polymerase III subunit gamma/tau n=1 Tax=Candidatus Cyanaurora vandensis TaxID=2714958 RepID=UPI00257A5CF9|nr:DNA polymerase III subunit gamma/tau [Candidatus Cyanaurora vandensis]
MYQPLFLKYRPQTFSQLVGQEPIVVTLSSALKTNRLAHAYLFTGSRGTGKTSTARILAKAVNCEQGISPAPCGQCSLCIAITQGSALDVIEIDAASNTGVDNIREIIERAQLSPAQARYKVYVIDEVHMLSNAAFNALLKTLEEPPQHVIFILATTDPQRVLPTIISRCQRFDFKRIPLTAMTEHLSRIALAENIQITPMALELVGQIAQGGLRDAESLLDQLGLLEGPVQVDQVWDLVGAVPERDLLALLMAIQQQEGVQVIGLVRKLLDHGREPLQVLQDLVGFLRDSFLAKVVPQQPEWVALTRPTWEQLVHLGPGLDTAWLTKLQTVLREAEPLIKHSTQPRLWLEVTLLELAQAIVTVTLPMPIVTEPIRLEPIRPEPVRPEPTRLEPTRPAPLRPEPPPVTPHPVTPPPVQPSPTPLPIISQTVATLETRWSEFTAMLRPNTKGILAQAFVMREDAQQIVFGFKEKFFINMLRDPRQGAKAREEILGAVEKILGKRVVHFELAPQGPPPKIHSPSHPAPPTVVPPPVAIPVATAKPVPLSNEDQEFDSGARNFASFFNGVLVTENTSLPVSTEVLDDDDDF